MSYGSKVIANVKVDNRQTDKQTNKQTNRQTNKQTDKKQYAPDLRSGGIKIHSTLVFFYPISVPFFSPEGHGFRFIFQDCIEIEI